MTDKVVVGKSEEEKTSQDSSPQSEQAITEPEISQEEVAPQETPEEVSEETSDVVVEKSMTEEQRKAFQEQRLEIKRLKEEKAARAKIENSFDLFKPQGLPNSPNINNFTDIETGQVNWPAYNQSIINSAQTAASITVREQLDEERARDKYPEVFADQDLENAIYAQASVIRLQGQTPDFNQIASTFAKKLSSATTKAEKEGAKKALTELTPKEQASLSVQGQSTGARQQASAEEEETLKYKARYGDEDSLAKLIGGVSWKK